MNLPTPNPVLPSSTDIHYFVEVAGTLNVSRAAERLGIRQPTLSLAIRRLEDSVGVPLFIRTKTGMQLTRGGRTFLREARSLLEQWKHLHAAAQREDAELSGRYTLGVHSSVALSTLPHFLGELLETYPGLEIDLIHDHSRKLTEEIIRFKVDFGIVVNPWAHPDLAIRPLYNDEVTLWTSMRSTALQDPLGEHSVLICDPALGQSQEVLRTLSKHKLAFRRMLPTHDLELVAELTACGVGVGLLPRRVAERVGGRRLTVLDPAIPVVKDRHCLVFRPDAQHSAASRIFSKWLREKLAGT